MTGEFAVSNAGIAQAFDLIARAVRSFDCAEAMTHRLSVVLDEICSNMIRHDHTLTDADRFSVEVARQENLIVLTISDPGQPFNPFEFAHTEVPEIGGQGISLVKGLSSSVNYSTKDGRNKVDVRIDLTD